MNSRKFDIYQVDAFTDQVFRGNPAAVCPVNGWLPELTMLSIAEENNLSETAFVNLDSDPYGIRWFTPRSEVDLCGHATLASAKVLFDHYLSENETEIVFNSNRGRLEAIKKGDLIALDFPSDHALEIDSHKKVARALGVTPSFLYKGKDDLLAVFNSEKEIRFLVPDRTEISMLDCRGIIATAPGTEDDFVSRCFYPGLGVIEDPVTGSAHTLLAPYWGEILDKKIMKARQISEREGRLLCELKKDRVLISGRAVTYMVGEITI